MFRDFTSLLRCLLFVLIAGISTGAAIIKSGDVLDIQVMSHPEFSGRYLVASNGSIDYPLISDQPVININTSELMNELTFRLARHIDNPLVLVSVVGKPEMSVTVLGEVVKPGEIKISQGATLQEIIVNAGGPVEKTADISRIKVIHNKRPLSPEMFNLDLFLEDGDINKMPQIEADDIIVVLTRENKSKVKVIGAVQKPGFFELEESMNIFELIYLAGGPTEKADLTKIRRFSKESTDKISEEIINVQSYIDEGKMDKIPFVNAGDVIIIYNKWFDWKILMTVLNNTLLFVVTIQAFSGVFK
jgi:protein involved in polysaccharide export with SLBB domain